MARTKVAVLGGGPAAITAAFELTASKALRERFDVTIYQLGWRLGGKCASGRRLTAKDAASSPARDGRERVEAERVEAEHVEAER